MVKVRNQQQYDEMRARIIKIGMELIRAKTFSSVGINDILKEAQIPKGSFYHYFSTKEDFGVAIAETYHEEQITETKRVLGDLQLSPIERLVVFFENASQEYQRRDYENGCLMCNLSVELGDRHERFQEVLKQQWNELTAELQSCLSAMNKADIGLEHLSDGEAADWLINTWSGALVRMKVEGSDEPLTLFMKTVFKRKGEVK
jgi:TetR/AcrR family transcriptional repressor of nem operon